MIPFDAVKAQEKRLWVDDLNEVLERDNGWWLLWCFHWSQLVKSRPYDADDPYEEIGGDG